MSPPSTVCLSPMFAMVGPRHFPAFPPKISAGKRVSGTVQRAPRDMQFKTVFAVRPNQPEGRTQIHTYKYNKTYLNLNRHFDQYIVPCQTIIVRSLIGSSLSNDLCSVS